MYAFAGFKMGLDVRLAKSPLDQEALLNYVERPFKRWKLRVVKPDSLVAMKLKAYSERRGSPQGDQDRRDVLHLVSGKHATDKRARSILKKHRPELISVLD